ncbi:MAG: Gfo/Idh/MocA family oxidoreductase [Rhodobiaceae bacterium]|nr:Gfo/Idh/MocA family oxidoreductase [Rhodobiaceae bacterium]
MRAHLPAWHATGDAEVKAVCTSRRQTAEAAARRYDVETPWWDAAAMCADPDLDIIDVGTRPDLRAPMVLAALANRKHVFAGANFAPDLATARIMRDAAREAGTICALDSVFPWQPAHREVKRLLDAGDTGRPVAVCARLHISHFAAPGAGGAGWKWFGIRKHGASAMRNLGTHSLHLLTWLLGPVEAVAAQATIAKRQWYFPDGSTVRPEVEDTAHIMLRFASGVMGTLCLSWSSPAKSGWRMELTCERSTLVTIDGAGFPCGARVRLYRGTDGGLLSEPASIPCSDGVSFESPTQVPQIPDIAHAAAHMIKSIRYGGRALPDFEDAFHVEAILDAARQAAETRSWMEVVRS